MFVLREKQHVRGFGDERTPGSLRAEVYSGKILVNSGNLENVFFRTQNPTGASTRTA